MNLLVIPFLLICGVVVQALLPAWGGFAAVKAPVLLGVVVYLALTRARATAVAAAVAAGILQDGLGLVPLGYSSACFALLALAVYRFREEVFILRGITHVVFGALAAAACAAVLGLLLYRPGVPGGGLGWVVSRAAAAGVLGAVVVPVVCRAAEELDRRLGLLEGGAS